MAEKDGPGFAPRNQRDLGVGNAAEPIKLGLITCPACKYQWKARGVHPGRCPRCRTWLEIGHDGSIRPWRIYHPDLLKSSARPTVRAIRESEREGGEGGGRIFSSGSQGDPHVKGRCWECGEITLVTPWRHGWWCDPCVAQEQLQAKSKADYIANLEARVAEAAHKAVADALALTRSPEGTKGSSTKDVPKKPGPGETNAEKGYYATEG